MTIARDRFDLALERVKGPDWEQFEQVASAFLVSDYKELRTMASPSGDGGRDSQLFAEIDSQAVAFQYSVTPEWRAKINATIKRLEEEFPSTKSLIYVTNQIIGALADGLRKELRGKGWYLDVFDRSWFLERANMDRNREAAAERLAIKFVDPLVSTRAIDEELVTGPKDADAKTALLFLEMQIKDSDRSYGLTKSSYDALTLAALRDTSTAKRISKSELYSRVEAFLPSHPAGQVRQRVDAALTRLKDSVRHRKDKNEYHLTESKIANVTASVGRINALKVAFEKDLTNALACIANAKVTDSAAFLHAAREIVETYFLRKGEAFAQAAVIAKPHTLDEVTLKSIITANAYTKFGLSGGNAIQIMTDVLQNVLSNPEEGTEAYLKVLLESYTLFAFLAATPDVQRATKEMFGGGELWIDASVLLPIFAEVAAPKSERPFTDMFRQAKAATLKLYVTDGVLQEVERHINRCRTFVSKSDWTGFTPYLFSEYSRFGGNRATFNSWVEQFIGDTDPVMDLAEYLRINHKIYVESASAHPNVPQPLADAIREAWHTVHEQRRDDASGFSNQVYRLAEHDAETYLHVLSSRIGQRGRAPLGYSDWWLTLDRKARDIMSMIPAEVRPNVNVGPVMSLDYLVRYLALGPNREKVDFSGSSLAKVYASVLSEPIPAELLSLVEGIRTESSELSETIVQRRIRDRLNAERVKEGDIQSAGFGEMEKAMKDVM